LFNDCNSFSSRAGLTNVTQSRFLNNANNDFFTLFESPLREYADSSRRQFYKYCADVMLLPRSSLNSKVKSRINQQKLGMKSLSRRSFYYADRRSSVMMLRESCVTAFKSLIERSSMHPWLL
jgi:hypothetical protein